MRNVYVDFGKDDLRNRHGSMDNSIYFDGVCYHHPKSSRPFGRIEYGNKCRFLWREDKDYGYKIFTNDYNYIGTTAPPIVIPPTEEAVRLVFTIQKLFFDNGFSPEPYEVIRCEDKLKEYFAIKMETIKGHYWTNDTGRSQKRYKKWVERLNKFSIENKIYSKFGDFDTMDDLLDINPGHPKNCIVSEKNNKVYLVDVDIHFRLG